MNFYIGNSKDDISEQDISIEFSDELIEYIYTLRDQVPLDMSKLYHINPYDDIEVPENDLSQIIEICNYILNTSLLRDYEELEEGTQMLQGLVKIAKNAILRSTGLVSIGD